MPAGMGLFCWMWIHRRKRKVGCFVVICKNVCKVILKQIELFAKHQHKVSLAKAYVWSQRTGLSHSSSFMLRARVSPCLVLIAVLPPPLLVKVNDRNSGYSCSSAMWSSFMWGQGVVLKTGRETGGGGGKVNWLGRYFCWLEPSISVTIISVISSSAANFCCILGQTNALCVCLCVCVCSLLTLSHTHCQLLYLIGYMQIGPKLKATCKGTPHGTVLYTHTHRHTHTHTVWFLQP